MESPYYAIIKKAIYNSDYIFFKNSHTRKIIKLYFPIINNEKLYSFITPPLLCDFPQDLINQEKNYDVITIGSVDNNKNQELLIDAVAELNNPISAIIIGSGPLLNFLSNKVQKCHLDVQFTEEIPHKQIWHYLTRSRIYIHTSKSEGKCDEPL